MEKKDRKYHHMRCTVCMKEGTTGSCMLRFWDDKDGLKLPKLCPYGMKSHWIAYIPSFKKGQRPPCWNQPVLVRNADVPKKEIEETWAVRN